MQRTRGATLSASTRPGIDRRLLWGLIAATGLVLDQLTKHWAVTTLNPQHPQDFIGSLLRFQLVWNDGAAFSLGGGGSLTWLFTGFASVAFIVVVWFVFTRLHHRGWAVVLGLLTAGITGNLGDRIFRSPGFPNGHVVDFLQLPYWPIFNVADICVSCAAVGIVWLSAVKNVSPGLPQPDPKHAADDAAQNERAETEPAETEPAETEPAETEPAEAGGRDDLAGEPSEHTEADERERS